jgi:hypothetical protein
VRRSDKRRHRTASEELYNSHSSPPAYYYGDQLKKVYMGIYITHGIYEKYLQNFYRKLRKEDSTWEVAGTY